MNSRHARFADSRSVGFLSFAVATLIVFFEAVKMLLVWSSRHDIDVSPENDSG